MINLINSNLNFILFIIFIFIFNFFLINFFLKTLKIKKLIDFPDEERKIHKQPVQKIGGLIILINLITFSFFQITPFFELPLFALIISIFLIGFFDDLFDLNPYLRIFLIIFFLLLYLLYDEKLLLNKVYFETFKNYKNFEDFNFIFTIFCIVVLINAFNLFDGLNGLSLSYFLIIFIYLFFKDNQNLFITLICLCIILLYFNLKNKIFLGDSGVYILSIILGVKIIEIHNNYQSQLSSENIFILLMLPGIDMLRIFFERTLNKKMFLTPDKKHFHHYFLKKFGENKTLLYLIIFLVVPIFVYEKNLLPVYLIIFLTISIYTIILLYFKKNE